MPSYPHQSTCDRQTPTFDHGMLGYDRQTPPSELEHPTPKLGTSPSKPETLTSEPQS